MTLKSARIRRSTYAKIARSIWKSTLELISVDQGADEAFAAKYDEVRAMVCGAPAHGALLLARDGDPNRVDVTLTYEPSVGDDGRERIVVNAWYYGILFATELLVREIVDPDDELPAVANVYVF